MLRVQSFGRFSSFCIVIQVILWAGRENFERTNFSRSPIKLFYSVNKSERFKLEHCCILRKTDKITLQKSIIKNKCMQRIIIENTINCLIISEDFLEQINSGCYQFQKSYFLSHFCIPFCSETRGIDMCSDSKMMYVVFIVCFQGHSKEFH